MTRPIRWDLIEQNYDLLVKYATAIRVGTASTKAILRRFTRNASHPVYQAMLELGRAQKRWLSSPSSSAAIYTTATSSARSIPA
jgi:TnpA family transposase